MRKAPPAIDKCRPRSRFIPEPLTGGVFTPSKMSGDFQIKAVVAQGGGNQTIKSSSAILASTAP